MGTWERGLKEIQNEGLRIGLNLLLVDADIQQGHLSDAENKLKSVNELLAALDPQTRLEPQRMADLRSGKLAFLRGHFDEAINLVTDLASGKMLVQGEESTAKPHERFEAWLILGQANAELAAAFQNTAAQYSDIAPGVAAAQQWELASREAAAQHWDVALKDAAPQEWDLARKQAAAQECGQALKHLGLALHKAAAQHWNRALQAFEQAALYEPREVAPHLNAAEACTAARRPTPPSPALPTCGGSCRRAEAAAGSCLQLAISLDALIGLLDEQKADHGTGIVRFGRRKELMATSVPLQGVNEGASRRQFAGGREARGARGRKPPRRSLDLRRLGPRATSRQTK